MPRRHEAQRLARFPARGGGLRGRDPALPDDQRAVPAVAEAVAIAGVEVFFVLSGFVLAPQIVDWVVGRPWRNLGVFLARRWMRTIPPYVVALVVVALMTGNLLTADFAALSLLRREPLRLRQPRRLLSGRLEPRGRGMVLSPVRAAAVPGRAAARPQRPPARGGVRGPVHRRRRGAAVGASRPHDWDLDVRRVTLFRINSIVWGFLLYLALERRRRSRSTAPQADGVRRARRALAPRPRRTRRRDPRGRRQPLGPAGLSLRFGGVRHGLRSASSGGPNAAFPRPRRRGVSFYLGRISYSAYLFHIVIVMALKPMIATAPLVAPARALRRRDPRAFRRCSGAASSGRSWPRGPTTRAARARASRSRPLRRSREASALASLARRRRAWPCGSAPPRSRATPSWRTGPMLFYPASSPRPRSSPWRSPNSAARMRRRGCRAARAFLLFALALPVADALYRSSTGVPIVALDRRADLFLSRRARESGRLRHLVVLLSQRMDPRRRHPRERSRRRTRRRSCPSSSFPAARDGCSTRRSASTTPASAGRRSPRDKGDRVPHRRARRVADLRTDAARRREAVAGAAAGPVRPARLVRPPIEVVNAGTEAYTLEDNLERMRRDILPLKPDLIVSTHGMNGCSPLGFSRSAGAERAGRAAARLGAPRPRRADDRARRARLARRATRADAPARSAALRRGAAEEPLRRRLSQADRARARERRPRRARDLDHGGQRELGPREVKDFYGAVFKPIDDIIAANAAHNRLVRLIAREEGAPLIDMAAGVDGNGTTTSISTSSTSPSGATSGSRRSCSGRCCRSAEREAALRPD